MKQLSKKPKPGFVYFIEEVGAERVKIGFSIAPWKRLNSLRLSTGAEVRMLWLFEGTRELELRYQEMFQNHRLDGEWFDLGAVFAGFRYYGQEPDTFPKPERRKRKTLRLTVPGEKKKKEKKKPTWRIGEKIPWGSKEYRRKLYGIEPDN